MEPVTHVNKGDIAYAIICKKPGADGSRFFTTENDEFQIGLLSRPAGYQVMAHVHPRATRSISGTSEFLYIESGKVRINVFDEDWVPLAEVVLEAGDFLVFFRGGHAIEILESARVIEVKQGPYTGISASKIFRDAS